MTTHYEVLGIAPDATPEQVGLAYQATMAAAMAPGAHDVEQARAEINRAYATLSDLRRRYSYDMQLFAPGTLPPLIQESSAPSGTDRWIKAIVALAVVIGLVGVIRACDVGVIREQTVTKNELREGDCFHAGGPRDTPSDDVFTVTRVAVQQTTRR